jgi:hypothetical protein
MNPIVIAVLIMMGVFILGGIISSAIQYLNKKKGSKVSRVQGCKVIKLECPKVKMYKSLSPKEKDLYGILHTVKGTSEMHKIIHDVLENGDVKRFRELIKMLQDQAEGAPEATRNLIGYCAFSRLSDLKSAIV